MAADDCDERARIAVAALSHEKRMDIAAALASTDALVKWWLKQPPTKGKKQTGRPESAPEKEEPDMTTESQQQGAPRASTGANDLGRLNDALFAELENLRAVDPKDSDALKAEVERSKAVEGIARTIIDNAGTVLDATRIRASLAKSTVNMPRMLEG